jgi:predicted TIM-barrel fold metal-dependent hydrolase
MTSRKQWRDQVQEPALEPALPIIDAHHHIWGDAPPAAFEAYGAEVFLADKASSGHNVVASVLVDSHSNYRTAGPQIMRVVGETENAERIASDAQRRGGRFAGACAGIVPHADLCLGAEVGAVLDAHLGASRRMRGIRHMTAFDFDLPPIYGATTPGIMFNGKFREGFAQLAPRGLSFDAWLFHPQLPELVDLAHCFPGTSIVLDHCGGPIGIGRYAARRAEGFQEWKNNMTALAAYPNVSVKIGALNMSFTALGAAKEAQPHSSEEMAALQRDVVLATIDLFGPARCMLESNFPVDMVATSYVLLWNCFKRITSGYSATERAQLFFGTANRVYRLALS